MSKLSDRLREQGCGQVGDEAADALDAMEAALKLVDRMFLAIDDLKAAQDRYGEFFDGEERHHKIIATREQQARAALAKLEGK